MKKIVLFTVLIGSLLYGYDLWISSGSANQPPDVDSLLMISNDNPVLHRAQGRLLYQGQPFTGSLIERYEDGQMKAKNAYRDGWRDRQSERWYSNGMVSDKRYYLKGQKAGEHVGWWPDGQLKYRYQFDSGDHHGVAMEWYKNGQVSRRFNYNDGEEFGQQQSWRENGKLYVNYVVKNGKRYGMIKSRLCYSIQEGEDDVLSIN